MTEPGSRFDPDAARRVKDRERQVSLRQRRYAERQEVAGRLVHPFAPHGTAGGYQNWGCHCFACTEANIIDRRRWRKDDPAWTANQANRQADQQGRTSP